MQRDRKDHTQERSLQQTAYERVQLLNLTDKDFAAIIRTMLKEVTETVLKEVKEGASLVAQWLRICLPMQGTRVRALVWEDPTCRGATRPVSHNY